jgi:hypothetical protein
MVKVVGHEEAAIGNHEGSPFSHRMIHRRCSSCGVEWESAHSGEGCPLSELELNFLPVDWLMMDGMTDPAHPRKIGCGNA